MVTNILKGTLLFGILGPIIGLLVVAVPAMAMMGDWSLGGLALLVPAAYFVGGAPALITGLILGVVKSKVRGPRGLVLAALVGALCPAAYYLAVVNRGHLELTQLGLLFVLPGLVAGLVCGYIFNKPPNNSFKPNPQQGGA